MATDKRARQKAGRQIRLEQARQAQERKKRNRRFIYAGLVVVLLIGVLFAFAGSSDDGDDDVAAGSSTSTTAGDAAASTTATSEPATTATTEFVPEPFEYGEGECPAEDGSSERTISFDAAPQDCLAEGATYTAVFETDRGTVRVALDTESTPGATNNFVALSRWHYYDDTDLFRTDTSIGIIQGGSPHTQGNGDQGPGYTIPDEGFGDDAALTSSGGPYTYQAGDLVYARPGSQPDSSSAQFFFCVTDACSNLDSQGIYVEFGQTTEGLDVLEDILALDAGGAPSEQVVLRSVTIEQT